MKKNGKSKKSTEAQEAESEIREILRKFAQETLVTEKLRNSAANAIGKQPSYVKAMLNERNTGGLGAWTTIVAHCFQLKGLNLVNEVSRALSNLNSESGKNNLTRSESIFRNLERHTIVDEDVKLEVATMLDRLFGEVQKNYEKSNSKK